MCNMKSRRRRLNSHRELGKFLQAQASLEPDCEEEEDTLFFTFHHGKWNAVALHHLPLPPMRSNSIFWLPRTKCAAPRPTENCHDQKRGSICPLTCPTQATVGWQCPCRQLFKPLNLSHFKAGKTKILSNEQIWQTIKFLRAKYKRWTEHEFAVDFYRATFRGGGTAATLNLLELLSMPHLECVCVWVRRCAWSVEVAWFLRVQVPPESMHDWSMSFLSRMAGKMRNAFHMRSLGKWGKTLFPCALAM